MELFKDVPTVPAYFITIYLFIQKRDNKLFIREKNILLTKKFSYCFGKLHLFLCFEQLPLPYRLRTTASVHSVQLLRFRTTASVHSVQLLRFRNSLLLDIKLSAAKPIKKVQGDI